MQSVERVQLQPAYILHSTDFRDTSKILDVLTPEHGRLSLVARGAKTPNSTRRAILQPFRSLLLSWQGRGELSTLTGVEEVGETPDLKGVNLVCGYYISELVQRLVTKGEANAELFACYDTSIRKLNYGEDIESSLRTFEISALRSLGLIPDFDCCVYGERLVDANMNYLYLPEMGAIPIDDVSDQKGVTISGENLISIQNLAFENTTILRDAKKLMRWILLYHIGDKPIRSRELFHVYKYS